MTTSSANAIRVLHVDDELDFAETAAMFLEREDDSFTVETATSASDAIDRIETVTFDCVVSDYDMPRMDGIEFLERLQEDHRHLPFILFTGKGSEAVASEAISAGVTDYLQKTGGTEQYTLLANRIRQAVSRRRAETNYREIFEKATDGILVHDPDTGEVLDANEQFCEMNGYAREEVIGMGIEDFSINEPPHTAVEGRKRVQDAVSGEQQVFEWVNETKSGDRLPVEVHLKQTTIGGQDRVLALVRDNSERKERERALEETNAVLETIVEQLPMGLLIVDADRDILLANDTLGEILDVDVPGEDFVGRDCAAMAEEVADRFADPEGFTARIEEVLDRREPVQNELVELAGDGTLERDYVPYELPDGEANLWLYRDVTEPKRREKQLQALFDNAPVPIVLTEFQDGHPVVRDVNTAFEEVFGFEAESAVGRSLDDLVVPADCRSEASEINERVLAGDRIRTEVRRETAGGVRDFLLHSVPFRPGESGERSYAMYHDITERNEYKRELERKNDRLDEFARIVSHDLRNPLNVATGRLELAQDECESDYLDDVEGALDRMETLIADLLAFARAGASTVETEAVSLPLLIRNCWQHVETETARLEIDTNRVVSADEGLLRELVENLLQNAVEHGGENVTITVGDLADGFYVADDGPGVSSADRERVFEQGYSTTDDGYGFGLSIVAEIAEAHGWDVRVTDSESGGARFEISGVESADG